MVSAYCIALVDTARILQSMEMYAKSAGKRCQMTEIGATVYTMCLRSSASMGDDDANLEWIHAGAEIVKRADYDIALGRIQVLEDKLSEIREVWAGSEGGEPVTCQEAYFQRLAKQCYQIAVGALK
jgi:hypothetical protein